MSRFAPSTPAHYGAAFGAQSNLSTATSDAISVARQTYDKSALSKKALYDHTAVKSRDQLAAYVAPKLRILVSYIDNDAAGAKAAEQLRYISTTPAYKIGDFIGNNLSYVLKYGPSKDKSDVKKAIAYWNSNLKQLGAALNIKEREAVVKLAREYELESAVRKGKSEAEAEYSRKSGGSDNANAIKSSLRGKTWNDGSYTYEISSDGLTIKTGSKTFTPASDKYQPRASAPAEVAKVEPEEAPAVEEGLTQKAWFWPAVILGTTGLGIGAYFIFSNKSES